MFCFENCQVLIRNCILINNIPFLTGECDKSLSCVALIVVISFIIFDWSREIYSLVSKTLHVLYYQNETILYFQLSSGLNGMERPSWAWNTCFQLLYYKSLVYCDHMVNLDWIKPTKTDKTALIKLKIAFFNKACRYKETRRNPLDRLTHHSSFNTIAANRPPPHHRSDST